MSRYLATIVLLLICLLAFGFTGCQSEGPPTPLAEDETYTLTPAPMMSSIPEATDSEPTGLTVAPDFEVRRAPEEVDLYPFTDQEMASALEAVHKHLDDVSKEIGVLTYEVECIAYDPIMTDVHIRQKMSGDPVVGWTEDDYYQRQISFAVTYSATYDHEKSPMQDAEHIVTSVNLVREDSQSPWEFYSNGAPVEEYSRQAMSVNELAKITDESGRVLAGYVVDDAYWLYLCDDSTGETQFFEKIRNFQSTQQESPQSESLEKTDKSIEPNSAPIAVWDESTYQEGSPITPQPGDTQNTWKPSLAATFPADGNCSDMELLEKWMTVEGLTIEDLEERGCEQLVLVVARETDGVQTYTLCYQKQIDGSWNSVDGLTWMQGWTGSNGIMHRRKRDSNTSPAGLWSLGLAFGNSKKPEGLNMPWRDVTSNTDWVCDEGSIYFNTWQERDDPTLLETWSDDVEHLENYATAYAYACVIRFNTPPYMIPERGCAIFLHCSKGATGGCIGLPEADLVNTLLWMNPKRNPYILITGYQKRVA